MVEARDFALLQNAHTDSVRQTASYSMGAGVLSPGGGGGKRLGRKIDHSHPCSAEVRNKWKYILLPLYAFMEYTWAT